MTSAPDHAERTAPAAAPPEQPPGAGRTAARLRLGVLALAGLVVLGTAFDLYATRHWTSPAQLLAWAAVLLLALAIPLARSAATARPARAVAALVLLASAYGVLQHLLANYGMGLSMGQAQDLGFPERVWQALTMATGHAPPLAPGLLAHGALLVLLATTGLRRHPAAA